MANFQQFIKNLGKRGEQIEKGVEKVVRASAIAVDAKVVQSTPVDTGRARSNWITQINTPSSDQVTTGITKTGQVAIDQGKREAAKFNIKVDNSVHITNNLPYIGFLNRGSSAQAPVDFVKKAVEDGARVVRRSKLFKG